MAQSSAELGVSVRYLWDKSSENLLELELTPAFDWSRNRELLRLSGRLRVQDVELLDRRPPNLGTYSAWSRPREVVNDQFAELRDVYASVWRGRWQFTIGKQQLDWGKLDGYKILDALNPQDFREFILDDFDDARISTWSARVEHVGPAWQWELFYSPDRTVHDLPDVGTVFAFRAPRFRFGLSPTAHIGELATPKPDRDTFGLRVARQADRWSWSVVYIDGFEFEPSATSVDGRLNLVYPRRQMVGGNVEHSFGNLVLRAEAGWRKDRQVTILNDGALVLHPANQVSAAIGIDYAGAV